MSNELEKGKPKYFNLSPLSDIDEQVYFDALDEKLADDGVKNIAIAGPYGSGKSTVLESYFAKKGIKEYLRISLANFCESTEKIEPEHERKIEEQILQQLFYQLSHEIIPFSGFKKISHKNKRSQQILVILIILWLFSAWLIPNVLRLIDQNLQTISIIGFKEFFSQTTWLGTTINILTIWIFGTGLFYILKEIIHVIQKGHLKKIVMESAQVELSEDSALNKHIDEIIYFFEATDRSIVIIEDLDRFNSILLFSKLREVNFIINNSPKVKQIVKFVYAIRDEVFNDNLNRTKFFDFILPIVPVINTTNSGDKLSEYFKNEENITATFINDIGLFIHDLRLMKNVVNEYRIFCGVINKNNKKRNVSLLSIILYKNMFPSEFGLEQTGQGLLSRIFNDKKTEILDRLKSDRENKLRKLTDEKDQIISALALNEEKLREEYILEILKSRINIVTICNHSIIDLIKESDYFNALYKNPHIQSYENNSPYLRQHKINFEEIQKKVNPIFQYEQRLELLKQGKVATINELESQIKKIKSELAALNRQKLSSIIKQFQNNDWKIIMFGNENNTFSTEEDLLALLLRKGYIDENYQLYMSHFYPGALSLNDFEFLLNIKQSEGDNFNTELNNVNELFSRISEEDCEYEATLNKELIYHLLKRLNYKEDKRLDLLLTQFKYLDNPYEKYIQPLIERLKAHKRELNRLIELLVDSYFPTIWQSIDMQNYDDNTKDELLKLFLFLSEDKLKSLNASSGNESLKNYLTTKENFIDTFNPTEVVGDIPKLIKALNIKFQNLKFKRYKSNHTFNYIIKNDHYALNVEMLYLMLFHKYKLSETEYNKLFYEQNYTSILESNDDRLINYVVSNYNNYLTDIYLKLGPDQAESEDAIVSLVELLEHEKDSDILYRILSKVSTQIKDIERFGQRNRWNLLFETNCVEPNWKNIIAYFKENDNEKNETITKWLNDKRVFLKLAIDVFSNIQVSEEDEGLIQIFMNHIIENNDLDLNSYQFLLLSFHHIFTNVALDKLSHSKISKLIELRKIEYNSHHYDHILKLKLQNELFIFTSQNISIFIEAYNKYTFDLDLHIKLLESKEIELFHKKSIIKQIPIENIRGSKLSILIGNILLKSNEDIADNDKIITVIRNCSDIDINLGIFNKYLNNFKYHEIDTILVSLGGVYEKSTILRKRPSWALTRTNQSIAQRLTDKGFFKSYEINEKKKEINIVVRYN